MVTVFLEIVTLEAIYLGQVVVLEDPNHVIGLALTTNLMVGSILPISRVVRVQETIIGVMVSKTIRVCDCRSRSSRIVVDSRSTGTVTLVVTLVLVLGEIREPGISLSALVLPGLENLNPVLRGTYEAVRITHFNVGVVLSEASYPAVEDGVDNPL